jgi:branched-chain amino acid aminotransferase
VIWLNGGLIAPESARIDPADRGFLLGDGLFETFIAIDGGPIFLAEHLDRLCEGARALAIPLPVEAPGIAEAVHAVIAANVALGRRLAVRITLSRGPGARGLLPPADPSPTLLVSAGVYRNPMPSTGASATIVNEFRRNEGSPLARLKTLCYLDGVMACAAAQRSGHDEAILLNNAGNIACGSRANIFVGLDGVLATPPISDGVLPGITRSFALKSAASLGYEVREVSLPAEAIIEAREAFLTNSLFGVLPLRRIGVTPFEEGPICRAVRNAYRAVSE